MRKINLEQEKKFENSKISNTLIRSSQSKFYWATELSIETHNKNVLRKIINAEILEIGCSNGLDALTYTKFSKTYFGIDISDKAIKIASDRNLKNSRFICTDGHILPFNNSKFDFVIVNSLLHHLDLDVCLPEISRVLKDKGELIFREPLGTNLIFQLYRWLTPQARTIDERPFTFSDISKMKKNFNLVDVNWFGFTSILSSFVKVKLFREILMKIDFLLSQTPAKFFFWQFCGFAKKVKKN